MAKQSRHDLAPHGGADPITVLLTRPEAQSLRVAEALLHRFGALVQPVISPLMRSVFFRPTVPAQPYQALIFTSETGVASAVLLRESCVAFPENAYCVGDQTADAAKAAGFSAQSASGDAGALVSLIAASVRAGPFLYLHGRDTAGAVAETLNKAGLETISLITYAQQPCPLNAEANAILQRPKPIILPIYSPRSARLLIDAMPRDHAATLFVAAISPAVAEVAAPIGAADTLVASRPDAAAMLECVELLLFRARGS